MFKIQKYLELGHLTIRICMYVFMLYYSRINIKLDFPSFVDAYVQEAVTNGDEVKKPKRSKQEVRLCVRDTTPHSHSMWSIVCVPS